MQMNIVLVLSALYKTLLKAALNEPEESEMLEMAPE